MSTEIGTSKWLLSASITGSTRAASSSALTGVWPGPVSYTHLDVYKRQSQYTLAIDRQNQSLDTFFDPHHEAILRLIQLTIENAHKYGAWSVSYTHLPS